MDNSYLDILLALAAVTVPLALAGLLVELRSRPKSSVAKGRGRGAATE